MLRICLAIALLTLLPGVTVAQVKAPLTPVPCACLSTVPETTPARRVTLYSLSSLVPMGPHRQAHPLVSALPSCDNT